MAAPIRQVKLWKACVWAFLAMFASDIISTAMVIFESHYDANLAGLSDVFGYIVSLVCSVLAIDSILQDGWRNKRSLALIGVLSVSNYAGTVAGVYIVKAVLGG